MCKYEIELELIPGTDILSLITLFMVAYVFSSSFPL